MPAKRYFSTMTKKQEIRYHIVFWVLFIGLDQLLEQLMRGRSMPGIWSLLQALGFATLQMAAFYLNYAWICPRTVPSRKWSLFVLGQLGLVLFFPGLRFVVEEVILYHLTGAHNYVMESLTPLYYIYDNSYYAIRILLLSIVFYFIKHSWNTRRQVNALQLEKKKAELQALKNQLSPHFLFNTLNSFYADLYDTAPKVAHDILKLSEMLRYVTYENQSDTVPLRDDIDFLHHYIDLYARRFDGKIAVHCEFPEEPGVHRIPSLLLIHFVENAFKHGVLDDPAHPVSIVCRLEHDRIVFRIVNRKAHGQHYDERGIGQKNIAQRLDLLFAGRHRLDIRESETTYDVTLILPLWPNAIT